MKTNRIDDPGHSDLRQHAIPPTQTGQIVCSQNRTYLVSPTLPAATASTGMLLVPLVGVLSAAPIVGEPIGMREIMALMLTLGGVFLAVRKPITSN